MPHTYEGILKDDQIEWQGEAPPRGRPIRVHVTVLDGEEEAARGKQMAKALNRLAEGRAFEDVDDPVQWQRELRQDRPLPGREENSA